MRRENSSKQPRRAAKNRKKRFWALKGVQDARHVHLFLKTPFRAGGAPPLHSVAQSGPLVAIDCVKRRERMPFSPVYAIESRQVRAYGAGMNPFEISRFLGGGGRAPPPPEFRGQFHATGGYGTAQGTTILGGGIVASAHRPADMHAPCAAKTLRSSPDGSRKIARSDFGY